MKVLSLFDGMACGMLAMQSAGVSVDRYVAFEIDKYAVQTSSHNFPMIEHRGDVFKADFTEFRGFDFLVGGSPCTYWSIAQKNNRETEASGMGWELFSQYVRALREAQPMYFIYENNKSMAKAIRESITQTFGFDAIEINSALVSAQNRQRLYWVGKRNLDGTYSRVKVEQPEDRGILLRDVLDGVTDRDKGRCVLSSIGRTTTREYFKKDQGTMSFEPVKALTEREMGYMVRSTNGKYSDRWAYLQKPGENEKALCITANISKGVPYNICAEPVRVGCYPSPDGTIKNSQGMRLYSIDGKSVNLTAQGGGLGAKTGLYAIPVEPMRVKEATKQGYAEIHPGECVDMTQPNSKTRRGRNMADKSNCLMTSCQYYQYCGVLAHATPCEWDNNGNVVKAISAADGKTYPVYTVPEQYEFPVSDSQAYKMLGNGWTVEVIAHLIRATQADELADEQLDLFKMEAM